MAKEYLHRILISWKMIRFSRQRTSLSHILRICWQISVWKWEHKNFRLLQLRLCGSKITGLKLL